MTKQPTTYTIDYQIQLYLQHPGGDMTEWLLDLMCQIKDGVYVPTTHKEPTGEDTRAANNIVERFRMGTLSGDIYIGFVSAWLRKTPKEEAASHIWREWHNTTRTSQAQQ